MNQRSGFFPGFLDSDGRPWFRTGRRPKDYEHAIKSAFKIALLTHRHLFVPAGYFLDNPHIQRLFLRYRGDDNESRCFRLLMKDLLRISPNQISTTGSDKITEWRPLLNDWSSMDITNRARNTYLNCVSHNKSIAIQASRTTDEFVRSMKQALHSEWQIDLGEYLAILDSLEFRIVERGTFDFDSRLRQSLLTNDERFFAFNEPLAEKVQAIADVARSSNVELSRSFLRNPEFCLQIGVKDMHTLTSAEYDSIAPVLAHYHHSAFASAFDLDGIASHVNPRLQTAAQESLATHLRRTANQFLSRKNATPISWPLSLISFEDLWQLRLKRNDFGEYLDPVFDATRSPDVDHYHDAVQRYGRHVAGVLSCDFVDANPKELAAGLDGSVFADATSTKAVVEVAKFAFTFCRDFFPNIGKELQVRWFFRRLRLKPEK